MRRTLCLLMMAALCLTLFAATAIAQTENQANQMQGPPKVLYLIRESVKPGKDRAHNQHEAAWTQAFVKANYTTPSLGMSSVTGPDEDWFLVGYDSFAALQKDSERMDKDPALAKVNMEFAPEEATYINESRTIIAHYRPEFSYKPDFKLGEYRYFSVAVVRVRLGADAADLYKALNAAREKSNMDMHSVVYQVNSGMPAGTYISFSPLKDLGAWDEPPNQAYEAALKEMNWSQTVGKDLMNVDFRLFSFNPRLSIVPESVAAMDPAFWHPKEMMASKSMASKNVKPAAKKTMTATKQ